MAYRIRTASVNDAEALLAVYAPYVEQTCVSFELEAPSLDEWRARVEEFSSAYPYIVLEYVEEGAEGNGRIVGYAYAHAYCARAAYQWTVETSIYLAPEHTGGGVGGVLLDVLEELLVLAGFTNADACITDDNAGSITFHERHGYTPRGAFPECAYKLGGWRGIVWMEKVLAPHTDEPAAPHPLSPAETAPIIARANERLARR